MNKKSLCGRLYPQKLRTNHLFKIMRITFLLAFISVFSLNAKAIRRSKAVQRYSKDFNIAKFFCPTSRVACESIAPAAAGAIRSRSRGRVAGCLA